MITVTIDQHHHVLSIPHAALRSEGTKDYVFRLVGGKIQRVPVTLGLVNVERAEIAKGLVENDVVVLKVMDNRELRDGAVARSAGDVVPAIGITDFVRKYILRFRPG